MSKTITIGWRDLNDRAQLEIAEAYGYATAKEFEANENYDMYPCFEFDAPDNESEDDDESDS